ncbi:uncharacterized protein UTRI_06111 [Ustilago trichophora]|uniref:Uncharacterized protein n=1 Tax=Ustilago trichophora TaxID=86804 RepID=A0A5C3EFF0_9BASI|nr:uncharacterized protein UTRI_06111 [Ustilago trichophora]
MLTSITETSLPSFLTRNSKQPLSSSPSIPPTTNYTTPISPPTPTKNIPLHPSPTHPSHPHHHHFTLYDHLWRHHKAFSATWGISVLQPWEQLFTFLLLSSLLSLFAFAFLKLPPYTLHSVNRLSYYIFGASNTLTAATAAERTNVQETMLNLDFCRQVFASSLNTSVMGTGEVVRGVGGGWLSQ